MKDLFELQSSPGIDLVDVAAVRGTVDIRLTNPVFSPLRPEERR